MWVEEEEVLPKAKQLKSTISLFAFELESLQIKENCGKNPPLSSHDFMITNNWKSLDNL